MGCIEEVYIACPSCLIYLCYDHINTECATDHPGQQVIGQKQLRDAAAPGWSWHATAAAAGRYRWLLLRRRLAYSRARAASPDLASVEIVALGLKIVKPLDGGRDQLAGLAPVND